MILKRVQTKKLQFRVYHIWTGGVEKPKGWSKEFNWFVYENTQNKYLCQRDFQGNTQLFLNKHTEYYVGSLLSAPGWFRTRAEARAVCWWAKHMMRTVQIREED